jgi:hypothetical protein
LGAEGRLAGSCPVPAKSVPKLVFRPSHLGCYGGYYIPQDRFSVSFGSQHCFRIGMMPSMYMGYPRFFYGGCSFLMVDPWPGDWPENWYSNDDVYIDYDYDDGGYYLYNRSYPQYRFAVTVVFRFRDPLTAVSQDTGSCTQLVNTFSP